MLVCYSLERVCPQSISRVDTKKHLPSQSFNWILGTWKWNHHGIGDGETWKLIIFRFQLLNLERVTISNQRLLPGAFAWVVVGPHRLPEGAVVKAQVFQWGQWWETNKGPHWTNAGRDLETWDSHPWEATIFCCLFVVFNWGLFLTQIIGPS